MYFSKRCLGLGLAYLLILSLLTGCVQTLTLVTLPFTAIQLGSMAYQSVEKADINAAVVSGVAKEDLREIKHVAIFLKQKSPALTHDKTGDMEAVVGDNLRIELMKLGFKVCDGSKTEKFMAREPVQADFSTSKMAKAVQALGVQAIVTGKITTGQNRSLGMLGVGRFNTVVQSASLKIIGVENAATLMIVTIDYKIGQSPQIAAKGIATALKTNFENPPLDINEEFFARSSMPVRYTQAGEAIPLKRD